MWGQLEAAGEARAEGAEPRVAVSGRGMVKEVGNRGVERGVMSRQGGIGRAERE